MDLLRAEIERKRKATAALIDEKNPEGKVGSTRFVRQSDVMDQREREQAERQAEMDRKRQKIVESSMEKVPARGAAGRGASQSVSIVAAALKTDYSTLSISEVKNRLRSGGHPITFFGETADERIERLRVLEQNAVNEDDFKLTAGHTNVAKTGSEGARQDAGQDRADDLDDEEEDDADDGNEAGDRSAKREFVFEQTHFAEEKSLPKRKVIYKYFRYLLKCWEHDLNQRPDADKNTAKGKMETRTQKQCKDYIRHLFKLCKKDEVPFDIEFKLHLLVGYCEAGDFRAAHDEYLQAAIGKAAWPIGLTMVGIHERSGRERISTSKVAHVMNNEAQRKYFTSVKRLMTYAQKKRPDVAPSMKVLC